MKKIITLVIVASAILFSSCASYTCPTYSKAPQKPVTKESRI